MSNAWKRALGAMVRAAVWLPFLLGVAATQARAAHGQTTGLPAVLNGDCVTNAAGSLVCTKTNGVRFGAPASFAQGFAGSQNHLWLMTEGSGNTLADYFGTANATSNGTFAWTADGGLSFSGGYSNRAVAANATTFLTMEVVFVNNMAAGVNSILPLAYGGVSAASATKTQLGIGLYQNWTTGPDGGTTSAAQIPVYPTQYEAYNAYTPTYVSSSLGVSTNGVHVMDLVFTPGGKYREYLDGVYLADLTSTYTDLNPTGINGGYLEIGGSPLGYVNCSANVCGFNGLIYGAATYSASLTDMQVQANYLNWVRNVLPAKGVLTTQFAYTNNGNGAQGTAGKAVNLVTFGESVTWGHAMTTPATQSFSAVAAASINGGNTFGLGYGYDARTEYVMHRSLNTLQSMWSPSAINVAVLFSNANDCRVNGSTPYALTYPANVAQQAARDLVADAQTLQAQGWKVLVGTGLSGTWGTGDTGKNACNAALRPMALGAGIPLYDIANFPGLGADGANALGGTGCLGSACNSGDRIHPSVAGQQVMGAVLARRVNALLFPAPVTTTAATYAMTGTEQPLFTNPAANNQTVTLPDCVGFTGTTFSVTNLQTSGSNTVTVVPASSGETMNGLTTYALANASTVTFKAINGTDAAAGCTWQMK